MRSRREDEVFKSSASKNIVSLEEFQRQLSSPNTLEELVEQTSKQVEFLEQKYLGQGSRNVDARDELSILTLREFYQLSTVALRDYNEGAISFVAKVLKGGLEPVNTCLSRFDPETYAPKVNSEIQKNVARVFVNITQNAENILQGSGFVMTQAVKKMGLDQAIPNMRFAALKNIETFEALDETAKKSQMPDRDMKPIYKEVQQCKAVIAQSKVPLTMIEWTQLASQLPKGQSKLGIQITELMNSMINLNKPKVDHIIIDKLTKTLGEFRQLSEKSGNNEVATQFAKKGLELVKIIEPEKGVELASFFQTLKQTIPPQQLDQAPKQSGPK